MRKFLLYIILFFFCTQIALAASPTHDTPLFSSIPFNSNSTIENLQALNHTGQDADSNDIIFNWKFYRDDVLAMSRFDENTIDYFVPFDDGGITDYVNSYVWKDSSSASAPGRSGLGRNFTGVNSERIGHSGDIFSPFTIALMVYPTQPGSDHIIFFHGIDSPAGSKRAYMTTELFYYYSGGDITIDFTDLPINEWSCVVLASSTTSQNVFINGEFAGSSGGTYAAYTNALSFGSANTTGYILNGSLDEIIIDEGYNWSTSEIQSYCNAHNLTTETGYGVVPSNQTSVDEQWKAELTPYDSTQTAGIPKNSTSITIKSSIFTMNIDYPDNGTFLDNITNPIKINGSVNITYGPVNYTWVNDTRFSNKGTNSQFNFTPDVGLSEGNYTILLSANDSIGTIISNVVNFNVHFDDPVVNSSLDSNNSIFYVYDNMTFEINFTDDTNVYKFNLSTPEGFSYQLTGLGTNKYIYNATINISGYDIGIHNLTATGCDGFNCTQNSWDYYIINYTPIYESTVTAITSTELKIVIDYTDIALGGSSTLIYNETSYIPSKETSDTQINFTINITPSQETSVLSSINFSWQLTLNDSSIVTQNYTQTVQSVFLSTCNNLSNTSAINFTIFDETNNSMIAGDISGSFNFGPEYENTFTFENNTVTNLSICIFPPSARIDANFEILYSNDDYPERRYTESLTTLSNVTQIIPLYLLNVDEGSYVLIRVLDPYQNPLSGVEGSMVRTISGSPVTVEQQTTDDSGIATFFANPDVDYVFTFTKSGYLPYILSIRPTSSEIYTITMKTAATGVSLSTSAGIEYEVYPKYSVLSNNTQYDFMFNMTSDDWDITACTFIIKNASKTLATGTPSYSTSACNAQITFNTGNQSEISSVAVYELNGTYTNTVTREYTIIYTYQGDYSLMTFLDDIKNFTGAGFGDFGRFLLAIFVIAALVFYISKESDQLRSREEILIGITLLLIFIFSYISWLNVPYDPMPNIGGFNLNQWITFILCLLAGGSYLLQKYG